MKLHADLEAAVRRLIDGIGQNDGGLLQLEPAYDRFATLLIAASNEELTRTDVWFLISDLVPLVPGPENAVPQGETQRKEWNRQKSSEVLEYLRSMPRAYEARVFLPSVDTSSDFCLDLAKDIALFGVGEAAHPDPGAELSAPGQNVFFPEVQWRRTFLGIRERGYFRPFSGSLLGSRLLAKIKQVLVLLEHYRIGRPLLGLALPTPSPIVRDVASTRTYPLSVPDGLERMLARMTLIGTTTSKGLLQIAHSHAPTYPDEAAWENAKKVRVFFDKRDDADHRRLSAAMEWLVDSEAASDETMAYLAACIGLESLFGDDKNDLHTVRLADRYSWLFGGGRSDRNALHQAFLDAFKLRGELIHARQARLSVHDHKKLQDVRRILKRSVGREIDLFCTAD